MKKLVSILIPAYNAEKYIKQTIQSAINQKLEKKEIIIVDDGSTDNTLKIAKRYESEEVKVFTQKNMGACKARNVAFHKSNGQYIQWLDSDDILHSNKIRFQLEKLKCYSDPYILFTSSFAKFYRNYNKGKFLPNSLWTDLSPKEWLIRKFHDNVWMNPATWLISRELINLAGPWNEKLLRDQDGEYICRIVSKSKKIVFVHNAKCFYRIGNSKSLSMKNTETSSESYLEAARLSFKHALSVDDSKLMKKACMTHLSNILVEFYPYNEYLMKKAENIANELGYKILEPELNFKYNIIKHLFGWKMVKYVKNIRLKVKCAIKIKLENIG